jgi:hypothetical protein
MPRTRRVDTRLPFPHTKGTGTHTHTRSLYKSIRLPVGTADDEGDAAPGAGGDAAAPAGLAPAAAGARPFPRLETGATTPPAARTHTRTHTCQLGRCPAYVARARTEPVRHVIVVVLFLFSQPLLHTVHVAHLLGCCGRGIWTIANLLRVLHVVTPFHDERVHVDQRLGHTRARTATSSSSSRSPTLRAVISSPSTDSSLLARLRIVRNLR